jgi:predicted HicB family RNase H-like nuclease
MLGSGKREAPPIPLCHTDFVSDCPMFVEQLAGINDAIGFNATNVADVVESFHEAVDDYVATCERAGKAREKPYSGNVMFRISPQVHASAALAAQLAGKSLNQWGEEALAAAADSFGV